MVSQAGQPILSGKQIVLLIVLLLFCMPAGIIYLAWKTSGKTGLFTSLGCFGTPVLLVLLYCYGPAEIGENLPRVSWLQEDASDVSFYKSYQFTAYEFSVSEASFLKHTRWEFQEIREPVTIPRYNTRLIKIDDCENFEEYRKKTSVTVKNGLYSTRRQSNGGGYTAAYDRETGKAYITRNPR